MEILNQAIIKQTISGQTVEYLSNIVTVTKKVATKKVIGLTKSYVFTNCCNACKNTCCNKNNVWCSNNADLAEYKTQSNPCTFACNKTNIPFDSTVYCSKSTNFSPCVNIKAVYSYVVTEKNI